MNWWVSFTSEHLVPHVSILSSLSSAAPVRLIQRRIIKETNKIIFNNQEKKNFFHCPLSAGCVLSRLSLLFVFSPLLLLLLWEADAFYICVCEYVCVLGHRKGIVKC